MSILSGITRSSRLIYALIIGILIGGGLLLLSRGGLFMAVRMGFNDFSFAPAPTTGRIVIIALDDASLDRYGSVPAAWSRAVYAELTNRLAETNARVVAFDLLFSESEASDGEFAVALSNLQQNSARTRVVLADAGVNSLVLDGSDHLPALPFADSLPLSPIIAAEGDYRGFTNILPDIDGVIRRQPSVVQVRGDTQFSFSIAAYLAYLRVPRADAQQVISAGDGYLSVTSERRIPVDEYGLWQQNYFGPPDGASVATFLIVPFTDVVDGIVGSEVFDDKIVLVGSLHNTAVVDLYRVPSSATGSSMSGVEIQANAIESLVQNTLPSQLPWIWRGALVLLLAVGASLLYAYPRWYFKVMLAGILVLVWIAASTAIFIEHYVVLDLFDTVLALVLPALASGGVDITREIEQRQQKERLLGSVQRLAEQRLQLKRAAAFIFDDIDRIAPGARATLYLRDNQGQDSRQRFRRGEDPQSGNVLQDDSLLKRYQDSEVLARDTGVTAIPLLGQGQQQGTLILQHPQAHLNWKTEQVLQELAAQLTPHLTNMLLYDEVQRNKTLFDSVFVESPAGIAIIDGDGRIVQCNQFLASLLDLPLDSILEQSLPELFSAKNEDATLSTKVRAGLHSQAAFLISDVTLGDKSVRIDIAPLQAYDLWTVIVGDVTALVELGKLKTRMLRIASHDLKNPLSRIMGYAELLGMQLELSDKQKGYLDHIVGAIQEMTNIINDILNLERLKSVNLILADVNLTQLTRTVCATHQADIMQKHHKFDFVLSDEPIYLPADSGQLSQAISNLVGNAIKYTPDNGEIVVRLIDRGDEILFEVEDNGYGIPVSAQDRLYTEFYRVKSDATSHIGGTGLGLNLVKSVVEAHGGKVGLTSTEGVGSTFFFTLPRTNQHA